MDRWLKLALIAAKAFITIVLLLASLAAGISGEYDKGTFLLLLAMLTSPNTLLRDPEET